MRKRPATGRSSISASMNSVFRLLDEIATVYAKTGFVRERLGRRHGQRRAAQPLSDGGRQLGRARLLERQDVRAPGPGDGPARAGRRTRATPRWLHASRTATRSMPWSPRWVGSHDAGADARRVRPPRGAVRSDLQHQRHLQDPQYRARGNIVEVESRAGPISVPSAVPRMSRTPATFKHAGVALGAHTDEVLIELAGARRIDARRAAQRGRHLTTQHEQRHP